MQPFANFAGVVCPLDRSNVDTDAIIPKQFLKSIQRSGFGPNLFDEWRYLDTGEPGRDNRGRPLNREFVLNDPRYAAASILLTRANFGCGSSREHAPWALADYGFKVILAEGFADIFFNNCFENGILPIVLDGGSSTRCLPRPWGRRPCRSGSIWRDRPWPRRDGEAIPFDVHPYRKHCLLLGLDEIGQTLQHADAIAAYEERRRRHAPWLF